MIRLNRGKVVGLLLTGFIIYFLFIASTDSTGDFRKRTEEGLSRRHGILQGDLTDEAFRAQTNQKLNDILASQKDKSGQRPLRASDEGTGPAPKAGEEDEVTVAGRKTMQRPSGKEKPKYPVEKANEKQDALKKPTSADKADKETEPQVPSDPGKDFARERLQEYLKKPLVIFSKSYCPHSKRAKHLLLDLYKITPTPLVVEIDQLTERVPLAPSTDEDPELEPEQAPTLGQKIQELLHEITGRRTVPNIVVGGVTSIGGNDLIWEMHEEGTLAEKIRGLGGKRITGVDFVEPSDEHKRRRRRR